MPSDTILAVDDEVHILELISFNLKAAGYHVVTALTGEEALKRCEVEKPSLVLLDIMLPGIDGLEVCRRLKGDRTTSNIPIIMLTARGDEVDKILGLELGADDYITKPFGTAELLARIRTALRHTRKACGGEELREGQYIVGDLVIDYNKHRAYLGGEDAGLTPSEFKIPALLGRYAGRVLTYQQMLRELWGPAANPRDNKLLRVHMANLRRKLEKNPAEPRYILTEVGVGYRMVDDTN